MFSMITMAMWWLCWWLCCLASGLCALIYILRPPLQQMAQDVCDLLISLQTYGVLDLTSQLADALNH